MFITLEPYQLQIQASNQSGFTFHIRNDFQFSIFRLLLPQSTIFVSHSILVKPTATDSTLTTVACEYLRWISFFPLFCFHSKLLEKYQTANWSKSMVILLKLKIEYRWYRHESPKALFVHRQRQHNECYDDVLWFHLIYSQKIRFFSLNYSNSSTRSCVQAAERQRMIRRMQVYECSVSEWVWVWVLLNYVHETRCPCFESAWRCNRGLPLHSLRSPVSAIEYWKLKTM